jgi:hypothetical protein
MLVFNNYFCKNRKSKLHFGDRVLYQTGGSNNNIQKDGKLSLSALQVDTLVENLTSMTISRDHLCIGHGSVVFSDDLHNLVTDEVLRRQATKE